MLINYQYSETNDDSIVWKCNNSSFGNFNPTHYSWLKFREEESKFI